LSWAAGNGHFEVARVLIDAGVKISSCIPDGRTALEWSAINGHVKILRLLIDAGANFDK